MKIALFSNYLTHHQIPFCNALTLQKDIEFYFVSTMEMEQSRLLGGWEIKKHYSYELKAYKDNDALQQSYQLARESDVMIIGSAPEEYVHERLKTGNKLTFRYSERMYKNGRWRVVSPRGFFIRCNTFFRYWNKPLYMLCASYYTAGDLAMLGSYLGRCFKWGYFPKTERYIDIENVLEWKRPASILWTARLIEWKHPEVAIEVAKRLKKDNVPFNLTMIGDGPLYKKLALMIQQYELQNNVKLTGSMDEQMVRKEMEVNEIFLGTSDMNEGWGAVINEAMNSGCAVVASSAMGAAKYLVRHDVNGYLYGSGAEGSEQLYQCVKMLLGDSIKRKCIGKKAYYTIVDEWNAENAAMRLIHVCNDLLQGKKYFYSSGICSKAEIDFLNKKRM